MAGLLNIDFQDPETASWLGMASGLLSAGAPSRQRIGTGQALMMGLQGMSQGQMGAREYAQQQELMRRKMAGQDLDMQMGQMKLGGMQQEIKDREAAKLYQAKLPEIIASFGNDYQGMVKAGLPYEMVKQIAESRNLGRSKVARTLETEGADGQKIVQQLDDYGNQVGQGMPGYVAPQLVDQGGKTSFVKPTAGLSFNKTLSPSDQAANARAYAQMAQSERHFQQGQDKPVFNAELGGFVSPKGGFVPVQGISQKTPKMTEDQSKATGWLVQAENAWKNMQQAGTNGKDAQGNFIVKDAAKPGFNDVLAAVPSFGFSGGVANTLRSSDRQKFMQASSSLSESLLRAATGAGVNKDEAAQKIAELTPQIGDSNEVTQQKLNAIPLYIESLKVRSGAGAGQAENIFKNNSNKAGGWSIQKVN